MRLGIQLNNLVKEAEELKKRVTKAKSNNKTGAKPAPLPDLTKDQKKMYTKATVTRYLKNPSRCPKCPAQWWDIYKLIDVEAR